MNIQLQPRKLENLDSSLSKIVSRRMGVLELYSNDNTVIDCKTNFAVIVFFEGMTRTEQEHVTKV